MMMMVANTAPGICLPEQSAEKLQGQCTISGMDDMGMMGLYFADEAGMGVNMHSQVWVIKHNGCRVVNHNTGMLITHGKWEINVISSHNSAGSDWNGHSICKLNVNGIGRGNRSRGSWHGGAVSGYTHCRNICALCRVPHHCLMG